MLDLLQEALQYIEKQNQWIFQLKSTIVEKEKSMNEMHTKLSTRIFVELKKQRKVTSERIAYSQDRGFPANVHHAYELTTSTKPDERHNIQGTAGQRNDVLNKNNSEVMSAMTFSQIATSFSDRHWGSTGGNGQMYATYYNVTGSKRFKASAMLPTETDSNLFGMHKEITANNLHKPIYNCPGCTRYYKNYDTFQTHLNSHAADKSCSCRFCGKKFNAAMNNELIHHIRNIHPSEKPYECQNCKDSFFILKQLKSHKCVPFGKAYTHRQFMETRKKGNSKQMAINAPDSMPVKKVNVVCPDDFKTGEYQNQSETEPQRQVTAEDVQRSEKVGNGAAYDSDTLIVDKNMMTDKYSELTKQIFNCPSCEKSFTNYNALQLHSMRAHSAENSLTCKHCNQPFRKFHELVRHMRTNHSDKKPFQCEGCTQTFKKQKLFKSHRCFTIAETPFNCDLCNTSFTCWKYYIYHNQEHHKDVVGYDFASDTTSLTFHVLWKL